VISLDGAKTLTSFPRRNSLNAIRLVLAAAVIVSHAWPLGGFGPDPRIGQLTLGEVAVAGFFGISGWLITQSRYASTLPTFAWRRFLRIYPGYLAALGVVGFGFAPVAAKLSTGTWSPADGVRYLAANWTLSITDYQVGASLPATSYPAWNGSLWTLASEALCYAVIGMVVTLAGRRAAPIVVVALLVLTTLARAVEVPAPGGDLGWAFVQLSPFFFAGATLFVVRRVTPLHGLLAAAAAVAAAAGLAVEPALAALPLAYLTLWLGARLPLQRFGQRHDLSYGLYIYAFPVQQLLAILGVTRAGVWVYLTLGLVCTVPLAALSWLVVEQPCMAARRWVDRRPARNAPGRHQSARGS
jgi:peptidoglycan/LPS O-acetylase OafA/YrhL